MLHASVLFVRDALLLRCAPGRECVGREGDDGGGSRPLSRLCLTASQRPAVIRGEAATCADVCHSHTEIITR